MEGQIGDLIILLIAPLQTRDKPGSRGKKTQKREVLCFQFKI
ncbi:MAG: hypothetical protein ACERK6_11860 [Candidatus Aminicenantaceae bacterium]